MMTAKPNYGIDAPTVVRNLLVIGVLVSVVSLIFKLPFIWTGIALILTGCVMLSASLFFKLRLRDRIIKSLNLRGDEQVLDVGCGHGLMLIGAAKKLKTGKAVGIDIWQKVDQAGNSPEATLKNIEAENVGNRVELKDADARNLPFADETFDVIVSSFALHNIYEKNEREKALAEIVRVLKKGGRIAVADIRHSGQYAEFFRRNNLKNVRRSRPYFLFVVPTFIVYAEKI
ncbi:MAG: class I SAM-dependent methyltransferase [Acidobacteriota bacterium]